MGWGVLGARSHGPLPTRPPEALYIVYIYSICNIFVMVGGVMVVVVGAAAVGGMGKARPRGTAAVKTTTNPDLRDNDKSQWRS